MFKVTTRKLKNKYVTHTIFLLNRVIIENCHGSSIHQFKEYSVKSHKLLGTVQHTCLLLFKDGVLLLSF